MFCDLGVTEGGRWRGAVSISESKPDELFDRAERPVRPFSFDIDVAQVFPDMVRRSVPGYGEMVDLIGLIARRVARPGTRCYDLGCSLGAVSQVVLRQTGRDVSLIAVDNAPAMIEGLQGRLADLFGRERVQVLCADLGDVPIVDASLVVLNLTLQFVGRESRLPILRGIRAGLVPGGTLVLAEKTEPPDGLAGELITALHEDFKRAHGYSELAIVRKRTALEQVLMPDRIEEHEQRLAEAGFAGWTRWYQALGFVAWVAWT